MHVETIMTREPAVCRESEKLDEAVRRMWERDVGALPVVDMHGRVRAMVTDRDICMAVFTQGKPLDQISVGLAMSPRAYTVQPETPLTTAEALMQKRQVRRLPVVDSGNRIVGVLSLTDLARRSSATDSGQELSDHRVAQTLRAICTPRGPLLAVVAGAESRQGSS